MPKTTIKEVDLSTRVPSSEGVYAGIVIPAPKGEIGVEKLITSDSELLARYTPDSTIRVGYNMAFYSALAYLSKGNKLWVVRADNGSLYGGVVIKGSTASANITLQNSPLGTVSSKATNSVTLDGVVSGISVGDCINLRKNSQVVVYEVTAVRLNGDSTKTILEFAYTDADITVGDTVYRNSLVEPENFDFADDDAFLITGKNQGVWNNDIAVKVLTYANSPLAVKEPNAFMIQVYKVSTGVLLETFVCSRVQGAKDGYGQAIYVEDVTKSSNYIKVVDNALLPDTTVLKESTTLLGFTGGQDGDPVTDNVMINTVDIFKNKSSIPLTVLMDGGWTTPSYQTKLDSLVSNRGDCVALLSTPYASEIVGGTEGILTYRNTTLNLNSSYSSLYTPHLLITDRFNSRDIYVSPDGYAAAAISDTANKYEIWYAPAGNTRGSLNVTDVRTRFTEGEIETLYGSGVNPIKFTQNKGISIFGQKTLLTRPSSLDRLNVRLLLITIEPAIATFLDDFLFEFNDDLTRLLVREGIASYMDDIKARRGVYSYQLVCDETNNTAEVIDKNELRVDLYVQPTKVAENITLSVVITRTGFSLELA